jgi:hypothetical protein
MSKPKLSWKLVLYPHNHIGWRGLMWEMAQKLGYPYFAWNGLVYDTATDKPVEKMTVEDLV